MIVMMFSSVIRRNWVQFFIISAASLRAELKSAPKRKEALLSPLQDVYLCLRDLTHNSKPSGSPSQGPRAPDAALWREQLGQTARCAVTVRWASQLSRRTAASLRRMWSRSALDVSMVSARAGLHVVPRIQNRFDHHLVIRPPGVVSCRSFVSHDVQGHFPADDWAIKLLPY